MFLAHSGKKGGGSSEPLREHLALVEQRAGRYAGYFGAEEEARIAGMLHDLGKYSELFLQRLENKVSALDHWSAGACVALLHYQQKAMGGALAIQGHHIGLQHGSPKPLMQELNLQKLSENHPLNLRLTEIDPQILQRRLLCDGLTFPSNPPQSIYDYRSPPVASMLDLRMLFSVLVDADYIETEAHFQGDIDGTKRYRPEGVSLKAEKALSLLEETLQKLRRKSKASEKVNALRDDLYYACLEAAKLPPGLFTLTAPTGAGKTLAMLAFALRHVREHRDSIRRIIMIIPYLTIIEQTARIYRDIFQPHFGEHYVLEHHSLAGTRGNSGQDNEDSINQTARMLAENWDAPLIITTSVQCLESLFAQGPGACRKLHRLAGSVILFDEVQTLPPRLSVPTLAALSRLAERYGATVVFSTATQPAFTHLNDGVREYCQAGWRPREIVPENLSLFGRARRTHVDWTKAEQPRPWKELAAELEREDNEQVLCIVNLKRHAFRLAELLHDGGASGLFHLSTSMCPAHREEVLETVRKCLENSRPCRLISTQCVEAGVDVDFPVVYRAFGPLEAIAQAAGRCNRNDNLPEPGQVRVFTPESEPEGKRLYPPGGYEQAADVTRILLQQKGPEGIDIGDPEIFISYYKMLYGLTENTELTPCLEDALQRRNFVDTAAHYRLIEQDAINILVPYKPEIFQELREQLEQEGRLTREWIKKARPYTVSLFRPRPLWNFLDPAPLPRGETRGETAEDWFVYLEPTHYDPLLGLKPPQGPENWMI